MKIILLVVERILSAAAMIVVICVGPLLFLGYFGRWPALAAWAAAFLYGQHFQAKETAEKEELESQAAKRSAEIRAYEKDIHVYQCRSCRDNPAGLVAIWRPAAVPTCKICGAPMEEQALPSGLYP